MPRTPRFTRSELANAIAESYSWAGALRRLGYRSAGGNWRTIQKYAAEWEITTAHFDSTGQRLSGLRRSWKRPIPLTDVMVEGSTYSRNHLKRRLLAEGLKHPRCELCGQGHVWRGREMALILDHINGVPDDHRFENLRIVCPNCAATLGTHCGRKNRLDPRTCPLCGRPFQPARRKQKYCGADCGQRQRALRPRPATRKVARPPYEQLIREIAETSYLAVGRKYGVSDNAIRKWVRMYEREAERAARLDD